ncbi:hypothetical protein B7Z17_01255, partial [Candidatus Saccharibacteria bacterium 32-49-10]
GNIAVTQQNKPDAFDLESVKKGNGMSELRNVSVPDAQTIAGTVLGRQTAIVAKPETMITIVNNGDPIENFDRLLQNLSPSN